MRMANFYATRNLQTLIAVGRGPIPRTASGVPAMPPMPALCRLGAGHAPHLLDRYSTIVPKEMPSATTPPTPTVTSAAMQPAALSRKVAIELSRITLLLL